MTFINTVFEGRKWMYYAGFVAIVGFVVLTQSCKPAVEPPPDQEAGKLQESVAVQKKINQYFYNDVIPKLETCWNRLQGQGTIEMKYRYVSDADRGWTLKTVEVGESSLPEDQKASALACMQNAVAGTSFPRESADAVESYLVDWVWPVPLPADAEQQMARMIGASGGEGTGCDGRGTAPKCMTCSGYPTQCIAVCVGEEPPCTISSYPGGTKTCSASGTKCASGGLFGIVGVVMF